MRQREEPRNRDLDKVGVKVVPGCDSVKYIGVWNDGNNLAAGSGSSSL